jgi:hypothetical protein
MFKNPESHFLYQKLGQNPGIVCIRLSAVSRQPSAVSCPRSIVCCQSFVVSRPSSIVSRLLFVVRRLPVSPSSVLCPLPIKPIPINEVNLYREKSPGSSQAEGLKHPSPGQRPGINDGHPVRQAAGLQQTGCDSIHIHVIISISTQIIIRGIFDHTISFHHRFYLSPGDFICDFFVNIFWIQ